MSKDIITRAGEVIKAKTGGLGDGMSGYTVLALIDDKGYPTASTLTVAQADGIKWITFLTSPDTNKVKRIRANNKGSVCFASAEYNISLVGTLEVLTDLAAKQESFYEPARGMWPAGPEAEDLVVLRFNTERYNIFFADDGSESTGDL